jgi:uncharacterized protein
VKDIVILYHADCTDGFGGAYAAWKKFNDMATYIPVWHSTPPPPITDKEIYLIDFAYPKKELELLQQKNKRLVVLDHHIGSKEVVESMPEHVYDNERSGAGIAWGYFHPTMPVPRLIAYIQDNDLWSKKLPHAKEIAIYTNTLSLTFSNFELAEKQFEDDTTFLKVIEKGSMYKEYFDHLCESLVNDAEEVLFDSHTILAVNAPRFFRSQVGHLLAEKRSPFALVWTHDHSRWHFSLRGDGSIDLSEIAKRFGGGGHKNAAGFFLPFDAPFPFKKV